MIPPAPRVRGGAQKGGRESVVPPPPTASKAPAPPSVGGATATNSNKKNIEKNPPKRPSLLPIPKDSLEDAPIGPPGSSPASTKPLTIQEDEGEKTATKPVCQWTEEVG